MALVIQPVQTEGSPWGSAQGKPLGICTRPQDLLGSFFSVSKSLIFDSPLAKKNKEIDQKPKQTDGVHLRMNHGMGRYMHVLM